MNDFPSKESMENAGWVFSWNEEPSVFSKDPSYCSEVPATSYCGWSESGDGMLSFNAPFSGIVTLKYGQSVDVGSVHVKKNDQDIDSRSSRGSSTITFVFYPKDIIQIVEYGNSVINIHSLTVKRLRE